MKSSFTFASLLFWASLSGAVSSKPVIYSSFGILNDVVSQIAPADFKVESITPPDQDLHSHKISPKDVVKLQKADLILVWGLGLDQALVKTLEKTKLKNRISVVTEKIPTLKISDESSRHHDGHQHEFDQDPHLWQSAEKMQKVVKNIEASLILKFPDRKTEITKSASDFSEKLSKLVKNYKTEFSKLSESQRRGVTSHEAFAYAAEDLNIELYSIQGLDSEQSPSLRSVQNLIKTIREKKIQALFSEYGQSAQVLNRVSKEAGIPVAGVLYSDTLPSASGIQHYLELIDWNYKTLLQAMKEGPQ